MDRVCGGAGRNLVPGTLGMERVKRLHHEQKILRHACRWRSALMLAGALAAMTGSASANEFRLRYKASYLGVEVGRVELALTERGDRYEVAATGDFPRILPFTSGFSMRYDVNGRIADGLMSAENFNGQFRGRNDQRNLRLAFSAGDVVSLDVEPPLKDREDRVAMTARHMKQVVDPLTAMARLMSPVSAGLSEKTCNQAFRVHTGTVRADLAGQFHSKVQYRSAGTTKEAVQCSVNFTPLAGHRATDAPSPRSVMLQLATIGTPSRAIPVRLTVSQTVGTFQLDLIE